MTAERAYKCYINLKNYMLKSKNIMFRLEKV